MPGMKVGSLSLTALYNAVNHYFPDLTNLFHSINDFRQAGKIEYEPELIIWMSILERLAGFKSNNDYEKALNSSSEIEKNISYFLEEEIDELPSLDTLCYFFMKLQPKELHNIINKMFHHLDRKKFINKLKTKGGHLLLAIDGVQTFSTHREIEHSINREHKNDTKTYHQYFLEAKIVSSNGFVISLDTEFIENPTSEFDKQDCEQKAAIRLLERIAKEHPHLKFIILGDALYCNSVIMDICNSNSWGYSLTFKGKTKYPLLLEYINEEYNLSQKSNNCVRILKETTNTKLYVELRWCNNVKYDFGGHGSREINYLEGKIFKVKNGVTSEVTTFSFLVSEATDLTTVFRKFQECRKRWKIENEGFNFQKNNILNIGHSYSSRGHAGQNFYLIAQIAHTIIQLAALTDIAGQVRRRITGENDNLSQSLKTIFTTFWAIADRVKNELLEKIFKPPLIKNMRIRLKFA